ncbi:DVU0298 family protein [Chloroflexota bacterium]
MASKYSTLRNLLSEADFPAIVKFAGKHKRALSFLTALTYDTDHLISWRAVEALGLAASRIAKDDQEYIRIHLRRLVWLLNDESGGIGWRAPEALGEIIYNCPDLFAEFIPILVNLMDMEPEDAVRFRAGWLWAIGRLALVQPDDVQSALPWIIPCLDDPNPQARGMAVWCLSEMSHSLPSNRVDALQSDQGQVELYFSPNTVAIRIGDLAKKLANQT